MFSRFFSKKASNAPSESNGDASSSKTSNDSVLPNLSAEKLRAVIISLNQAEPIFQRAGYIMEQLDVELGNSPKLTPYFKQRQSISEEQYEELISELDDQQLIKFMLISLHKSARMQSLFENSELYYYGMEIDISSVPSVRTIFKRKDQVAEIIDIKPK